MLYEICSLKLYKDCLVKDLKVFLQDLETNPRKVELCGHISTLRVHQVSQHGEEDEHLEFGLDPETAQLLVGTHGGSGGDSDGGSDGQALDNDGLIQHMGILKDQLREQLETTAGEFGIVWKANETAFSSLVRVINTDTQHNNDLGMTAQQRCAASRRLLLETSTVQHYCQDSLIDTVGFDDCIEFSNPPKVFTFHPRKLFDIKTSTFCHRLPIIMGSVNRYMFDLPVVLHSTTPIGEDLDYEEFAHVFEPLLMELPLRPEHTNRGLSEEQPRLHIELNKNTTIELYHFVRHIDLAQVSTLLDSASADRPLDLRRLQRLITSKFASDLSRMQRLINSQVAEFQPEWEGRVLLKNAVECPPCSACGFLGYGA
jgi:hypothetical protein